MEPTMGSRRPCNGPTRRDCLRIGAATMFGTPLANAAAPDGADAKDVSLIYVFLKGGLSTIDTLDMKPDAPAEFRGEFRPKPTAIPGLQLCEHLPKMAAQVHRFSLVRSFTHHNSDHGPADHYMLTGYFPAAGFNGNLAPNNQRPSFGSILSKSLGARGSIPPYVCLPKMHPSGGSSYLGAAHAPFVIDGDPSSPNFTVPDLVPPPVIDAERLGDRKALLDDVDRFQRSRESRANTQAGAVETFRGKAFDLMTSREAKTAFDIAREPETLRDAYGRHTLGQSCLLARRLVEAGVRCVTVEHSNWDTHDGNFATLRNSLLPQLDSAVATLFADLAERGKLDSTLVVVTGEFGRTPRINKNAGRDHWGPSFTVLLGGGGLKAGVVVGASNDRAERPAANPYRPEDLAATLLTRLGVDPQAEFHTPDGRPIMVVNNGKPIRELA
jgi:hypothetical protein